MPQSSAPLVGVNLSDVDWRDSFGDEAGVLGDLDGSAYKVTLPTDSDTLVVGSTTQRSIARVAGFVHRIPAGETESLTVPAASGSARTDIIALRYDPAFTGAPGPVRLVRIAGTSAGIPVYDDSAPGVEDLPLWSITRQPGQALSQATVARLFTRLAPALEVPAGAALPLSSPIGTVLRRGDEEFRRALDSNGVAVWINASTLARLRLTATDDASATSTGHAFQIGPDSGPNVAIDGNEILARNNGAIATEMGFGGVRLGSVGTPTAASHAATKGYTDAEVNALEGSLQRVAPTALGLASGFEHWGFGHRNLCYWREGRTVYVAGAVRMLSSMDSQTTRVIATLPSGFRPSALVSSSAITTYARTEVLSNGQVRLNNDTFGVTLVANTLISVNMAVPLG